jgi:thiamine biosynthesis protein ThiI
VEAPAKYRLILFRRFMVRVAEEIAKKHDIKALGSGENLAQVSSQTLENMAVISRATTLPIFRPLLTYEKNETVNLAKQIRTFEISITPYKDCCSIFLTKHPATKAKLEIVEALERKMNLKEAIKECLEKTETVEIK